MDFVPKIFAPKQKLYSYNPTSPSFFLLTEKHVFQHNDINIGWEFLWSKKRRFLEAIGTDGPGEFASGHLSLDVRLVGAAMGWALSRPDLVFPNKSPKKWRWWEKGRGAMCFFFWNNLKWDEDLGWLKWDISQPAPFFSETSEDFWTGDLKLTALWWRNIASWKSNYFSWILEEMMLQ